ncbi:MAG: LacI family transcriptional regulator [Tissierellia bacterium]|nr:LacI family transcriptional regulator [Tissierellia bacterium]
MKKELNASDIAKIVGVSRSTVSRVVNNYGNVTEETREKVLKAIEEYNYVPHASAQMLAGKKSKIIGLFIIDTKSVKNKMTTSSYFSPFTSGVIDEASKKGYKVLIMIINKNDDYKSAKELFYNKTISGGIFIGGNNNEKNIKNIIQDGYKLVVLEQENGISDFKKAIIVNSDSFGGGYDATNYLIGLGHKSIAHICGDENQWTAISKIQGYKKALKDANIPINDSMIIKGNYTQESGLKAVKGLLRKEKPTAIFVANDTMSLGVYEAIKSSGLRIPEDISIIGFDDIEVSKYLQPPLTTVRVSLLEMAFIATNNLIQAIDEEINYYISYNIPVELVIRKSCKMLA